VALSYDAISTFEPSVPRPERDPVGVPLAAFIETDLVIVFDHLSHQLSAIASLHTEAPDLEGRYRIAERAIFEALERTARPTAAEMATTYGRSNGEDAATLNLVSGGLRVITGAMAKTNPENYKVRTPVALMGVRGTEFSIMLCGDEVCAEDEELAVE
jgi:hypothetical protein